MNNSLPEKSNESANFYIVLEKTLQHRGLKLVDICDYSDAVESRILSEYGAIFLVDKEVMPPPKCMFNNEHEVAAFQEKAGIASENIGGSEIELQPNAMKFFLAACKEAESQNLEITPRGGSEAARRSFEDTLRLWNSRFEPACRHWKKEGKLSDEQISYLTSLPTREQVKAVLEIEKQGIYFNTFFNYTILNSVASPGTSQHLSMLAIDIKEFANAAVRSILAHHGWFRTVNNDLPHFTFIGYKEESLENLGLKRTETKDGEFWLPNI